MPSPGPGVDMRRREFLGAIGGAAAWPFAARAQQPAAPVIGFLRSTSLTASRHVIPAFHQGLKEAGFIERQNVVVEYRYADNQIDRLPGLATELVGRPVHVIVANVLAALATQAATTTVPLVFVTGSDPMKDGLVTSLNRPGGNITGVSFVSGAIASKRLEMLLQLVPRATTMAMLFQLDTLEAVIEHREVQEAARAIGQRFIVLDVQDTGDIEPAFAAMKARGADTLYVGTGPFMTSHREQLTALAARHAIPAVYAQREFVTVGGLLSYGSSISDAYRQAGIYAGRILKGEKAGELPVMQASKFELALNLKAAKALGVAIPDRMLALADEVIE
jgi:putative ABC transport system substrate-binding protein